MEAIHTLSSSKVTFTCVCLAVIVFGFAFCYQLDRDTIGSPRDISKFSTASADDETQESDLPPAEDLVKDWEKPDVTLFISGRQHGYIEPCGCTGLENQKGGLMRRHTVMKTLQQRGWDILPIDAGNQIRRYGEQPLIKLQHTYTALCDSMKYQSVGFGPDDLKLAAIDIAQVMLNAMGDVGNPFTCANVTMLGDETMTNRYRIIDINGRRIGVTSILGNEFLEDLKDNDDLTGTPVETALQQVIAPMQQQRCDFLVLTAQTSLDNCRDLAKKFPVFDLLVTTGGAGDPTKLPERITQGNHTTNMIQVGVKGMYVGVVGIYVNDQKTTMEYERVPLDARFKDSPEMIEIFKQYQGELKARYIAGEIADIKPRLHESGAKFVGSEKCMDCHYDEYEIWESGIDGDHGPHHHATISLTDPKQRGFVQRHYDPECLSCHVTGWNPQNYFPYETGYAELKKDEHLHGNGCENCHGPGSKHIALEEDSDDEAQLELWRKKMRLTIEEAKKNHCRTCHDLDNSPDFQADDAWDKYWPQIAH